MLSKNIKLQNRYHLLTTPERVGEPAVDSAVELFVDGPEDAGAELDEVYDEAAHHKHKAHQQLQDEQALQGGQKSHGWGAWRVESAPLYTPRPTWERAQPRGHRQWETDNEHEGESNGYTISETIK